METKTIKIYETVLELIQNFPKDSKGFDVKLKFSVWGGKYTLDFVGRDSNCFEMSEGICDQVDPFADFLKCLLCRNLIPNEVNGHSSMEDDE